MTSSCTLLPENRFFKLHLYLVLVALLVISGFASRAWAATPSSGTLTDAKPKLTYSAGPFFVPNASGQAGIFTCDAADPCDTYTLTVNVSAADAATKQITIYSSWPNPTADFDLYVYDSHHNLIGSDTGNR